MKVRISHSPSLGQTSLEYLLLLMVVAGVVIASFRTGSLIDQVHDTSQSYFNTITTVIMGGGADTLAGNPRGIDGGWCPVTCPPIGSYGFHYMYRSCECPAPAFGGRLCTDSQNPNNLKNCGGGQSCSSSTGEVTCPGVFDCNAALCGVGQVCGSGGCQCPSGLVCADIIKDSFSNACIACACPADEPSVIPIVPTPSTAPFLTCAPLVSIHGTGTITGTDTQTATDIITGTDTQVVTGTATQTDTYIKTGTDTQTKTASQSATGTDTKTGTQTQTITITRTGTQTSTGTKTSTGTDTRTGTQTVLNGTSTKTATDTKTGTQTQTSTYTKTSTDTQTRTGTDTGTDTKTGTQTQSVTDTKTGTGTSTLTGSDTQTSVKTLTGTDTQTGTHTQTGTDTQTDTATQNAYTCPTLPNLASPCPGDTYNFPPNVPSGIIQWKVVDYASCDTTTPCEAYTVTTCPVGTGCGGNVCGDDKCTPGHTNGCGQCPFSRQQCSSGQCVCLDTPGTCPTGNTCGPDTCGNTGANGCGGLNPCSSTQICSSNKCVCKPGNCPVNLNLPGGLNQCGPDTCGYYNGCKACPTGSQCDLTTTDTSYGTCVSCTQAQLGICPPPIINGVARNCGPDLCGNISPGCGYGNNCPNGQTCNSLTDTCQCTPTTPCGNSVCGKDDCGQNCGAGCTALEVCTTTTTPGS